MLRRETLIALRARHTAWRIAMSIAHPSQPLQAPPERVLPLAPQVEYAAWTEKQRRERVAGLLAAVVVVVLLLVICFLFRSPEPRPRPPVPPARPILPAQ